MLKTIWAEVRNGKIECGEKIDIPEGTKALVTFLADEDTHFWLKTSQFSLEALWNNKEDDIYEKLLKE